ncbi:hypothetical protein BJ508DRAFT_343678 [Ascobolus immersus RN42]|uniref:F-box domain-containing protein n=1 Tax=Ascobolus immersus RN42 TaxID=1160509 RepID=A0A3N4I9Y3_ASCIM|nr:hypothetical protein BJ508DRAFT_343678 [Ascobolus immersus RN42]
MTLVNILRKCTGKDRSHRKAALTVVGEVLHKYQMTCSVSSIEMGDNQAPPATPFFPLLKLPNELIHAILVEVDNPVTYLNLYRVCHRIKAIASRKLASREFAERWLSRHCNDDPEFEDVKNLAGHIVRYIKFHRSLDDTCTAQYFCKGFSKKPYELPPMQWRKNLDTLVRMFNKAKPEEYDTPLEKRLKNRSMLSEGFVDDYFKLELEDEGSSIEDVRLEVEDVVVARRFWNAFRLIEIERFNASESTAPFAQNLDLQYGPERPVFYHLWTTPTYRFYVEFWRTLLKDNICICKK